MFAGAVAFTRLPLATKTQVELPRLTIQTNWPGASAELIESYLSSPIEAAIQPVRGVRKTSSESGDRGSSIRVDLDPDADVGMTRLAILERLELLRADLPLGVVPPSVSNYVPEDLDERPLVEYTVSGPYTPGTLAKIMTEDIEPRLETVEGVSGVSAMGGAETGVSVIYDPTRLRQLGVSPAAIAAAVRDARQVDALGLDQRGIMELPVTLRDQPKIMEDLGKLPVRGPGGRISRSASWPTSARKRIPAGSFNRFNGQTAVSMSVSRLAGSDAIKTTARIQKALAELQPSLAPGIRFRMQWDESKELADELRDLALRGAIAFLAVMLVLAVSLRRSRGCSS